MGGPKPLFASIPRKIDILLVLLETNAGLVGWGPLVYLSGPQRISCIYSIKITV